MRKVLSFVLVLAMILGSVSMVFATNFPDTQGKDYAVAASVLNDLGVISGYTDGTFGGEKNITRAEFATMIVNALGFTTVGSAVTGFTDVPTDYWAAQAILTAKNLGIVYGKTTTTFAPKDNITCDEAIAMLVRALGYKAEYLMGTYPTSYVNQAMTLGILDKVATGSVASTRGNIAQLIYNALGCKVVTAYNSLTDNWVSGASLIERLGYTDMGYTIWDGLDDNLGAYGKYYQKGEKKFFAPISEFISGKYDASTGIVTAADGTKTYVTTSGAAIASAPKAFKNGELEGSALAEGVTAKFAAYKSSNGAKIVYSSVVWTAEPAYFAEKTVQKDIKVGKLNGAAFFQLADKTVKDGTYFLNGVASLADIEEKDVVTYYLGCNSNKITRVDVSDKTVAGKITKYDSDKKIFVDGTGYDVATGARYTDGTVLTKAILGTKGTCYFDYSGKVAFYATEDTTTAYAVVLGYKQGATDGKGSLEETTKGTVELLLADGTKVQLNYKNLDVTTMNGVLDKIVEYGTTDDVVTTIAAITLDQPVAANTKVLKNSTIGGSYIATNCVTFVRSEAYKWTVAKTEELLGNSYELGFLKEDDTDRIAVIQINGTSAVTDETYYVFTGKWAKVDASTDYYELTLLVDGEEKVINAVDDATWETAYVAGGIYTATFDGSKISALTPVSTTTSAITYVSYKADSLSVKGNDGTADAWYSLDKNVVIYVVEDDEASVGTVSDLATDDMVLDFYDTTSTPDDVYDIVVVRPL